MIRIISLDEVGDPLSIEPLVRSVYGEGDRARNWFARKLHRECVNPKLSRLALDAKGERIGYVLVGAPPSGSTTAHTCGGGVVASMRRKGIGRALFEDATWAAHAAGYQRLRVTAVLDRIGFFERLGFMPIREIATLLSFATGSKRAIPFGRPEPWDVPSRSNWREHAAWGREPWERTEAISRATVEIDGVVLHVAREGCAVVAHRVCAPPTTSHRRVSAVLDALRQRLEAPTPTLVTGLASVSSVTLHLVNAGWVVVQRAVLVERPLDRSAPSIDDAVR